MRRIRPQRGDFFVVSIAGIHSGHSYMSTFQILSISYIVMSQLCFPAGLSLANVNTISPMHERTLMDSVETSVF
jgi:tetrahydromethanopterin S-methyltransferase subunit E